MNTFFMSYKEFSLHKNSEIRLNFIYNLPAVLEIFGIKFFEMIKSNYLNIFSNDNSQDARLCCIAILPTIIKMISVEEAHKTFAEGFCEYLLNIDDKNEIELLKKTLKILPKILEGLFSRKNYEDNESSRHFFEEILEILIRLQKKFESSNKWRLQFTLLQIFEDIK